MGVRVVACRGTRGNMRRAVRRDTTDIGDVALEFPTLRENLVSRRARLIPEDPLGASWSGVARLLPFVI
jgi:hypothetical protein